MIIILYTFWPIMTLNNVFIIISPSVCNYPYSFILLIFFSPLSWLVGWTDGWFVGCFVVDRI